MENRTQNQQEIKLKINENQAKLINRKTEINLNEKP